MSYELLLGDCLTVMATLEANSFDSIVCDPPYGLSFMNKNWDHGVPGVPFWEAALRVAKPGAMLLAFGGTRTHHRLMVAIEDAGWEIRDCLMWLYGSGFPKSMDIGKAIDKAAGAEREVTGVKLGHESFANRGNMSSVQSFKGTLGGDGGFSRPWMDDPQKVEAYHQATAPATDAAKQWDGWGTALKPAWEPIILAMKPLDGTFANNALVHGVAGLNVDGCRIGISPEDDIHAKNPHTFNHGKDGGWVTSGSNGKGYEVPQGRWPANVLLDEAAAALLDQMSGERKTGNIRAGIYKDSESDSVARGHFNGWDNKGHAGDTGGASRFFYVAKAAASERNKGLDSMQRRKVNDGRQTPIDNPYQRGESERLNTHPTVKPLELMRYLVRLTKTPFGGTVLDPFMGSGSTGCAAVMEGMRFIGIEISEEYHRIATKRLADAAAQPHLLTLDA